MSGYNEEKFIPEKLRSELNIPVKVLTVKLKAGESINEAQPVYYDNVNKEFTVKDSHAGESSSTVNHEFYGLSALTCEVDSEGTLKTEIPVYATGEFYKSSVETVLVNDEDIEALTLEAKKIGLFLD